MTHAETPSRSRQPPEHKQPPLSAITRPYASIFFRSSVLRTSIEIYKLELDPVSLHFEPTASFLDTATEICVSEIWPDTLTSSQSAPQEHCNITRQSSPGQPSPQSSHVPSRPSSRPSSRLSSRPQSPFSPSTASSTRTTSRPSTPASFVTPPVLDDTEGELSFAAQKAYQDLVRSAMAEEFIELGLEGFDRLVDKFHDRAYDTATDRAGRVWKKVHLPGRRKSVFVEQNPEQGEKPETYDPSKDEKPAGFKPDQNSNRSDKPSTRDGNGASGGSENDRVPRDDRQERSTANDRDYFDRDNLDSPRKPYPNEMSRDGPGYAPQPAPQGAYFQPPPREYANDYNRPPQANYYPSQYLAPPAAGAMVAQYQQQPYSREGRRPSRDDSPNRLGRQRSYDGRPSRRDDYDNESDSDFSPPPRRRRPRSEAPRDRRKSKDYSFAAGLAGAVAGGFIGRSLGKGDLVTTAAGAVVGALGGDIIADGRSKREKRDKDYDRRDRY